MSTSWSHSESQLWINNHLVLVLLLLSSLFLKARGEKEEDQPFTITNMSSGNFNALQNIYVNSTTNYLQSPFLSPQHERRLVDAQELFSMGHLQKSMIIKFSLESVC